MSFLFGNGIASPKQKQLNVSDTSSATNEQAQPLPYLAGKRRFAGTFITDAFDQSTGGVSSGGKDAGKGGGGSGTNYYAGFAVAFCLGPVDALHDLHLNGDAVFTSNTAIRPSSLRQLNNTAAFIAQANHNLVTGNVVIIVGADQPEFNGEFTVVVINANTFTYHIPGTSIIGEKATGQIKAYQKLDPIYRGAEDFVDITVPTYGVMRLYWGTETQPADVYLGISGTDHPPMKGICYAVFKSWFLGLNQTNIQNVEVTLSRTPKPAWLAAAAEGDISDEANPAVVFHELLTHPHGGLGLTDADFNLPLLAAAATLLADEGLGISPLVSRQDVAATLVQQLCETMDAILQQDEDGKLYLQVLRKPATYAGLPVIGDDELADLPQSKVGDWSSTFNATRIVFPNREANFSNDLVEWKDFGGTVAQKFTAAQSLQRDWITDRSVAAALVQAAGLAGSLPERTGTLEVVYTPARWATLPPGGLFKLDYSLRPAGGGIFRVTKRTLPDPARPVFTIEYAADRSYLNLTA